MKKDDYNDRSITLSGELTPFELFEQRQVKRALFAKLIRETQALVESIDKISEIEGAFGLDRETLEQVTDLALVTLANEMQEHFGVSA